MTYRVILSRVAMIVAVATLASACQPDVPVATQTPEANLRALMESSRRAQPPELKAASVIDLSAKEAETMNPDKHTYTVDPSVEYSDITIRIRPYTVLKGQILSTPTN